MIRLTLPDKPEELTEEKEAELVFEYKQTGKAVWKKKFITEPLLEMSNGKCAYSEQKLNSESAYMQVEHFKHKKQYPDLVVRWGNLLPSCQKCNDTKQTWDVMAEPIVNPLTDTPAEHLYVKAFRFYKKDDKGKNTIDAVALNDRAHFAEPRATIGFRIAEEISSLYEAIQDANTYRKKRNYVNRIKSVMNECGPKHVYSAVLSTFLLYELDTYESLKQYLKGHDLWDDEFEEIESLLHSIAMPAPVKK